MLFFYCQGSLVPQEVFILALHCLTGLERISCQPPGSFLPEASDREGRLALLGSLVDEVVAGVATRGEGKCKLDNLRKTPIFGNLLKCQIFQKYLNILKCFSKNIFSDNLKNKWLFLKIK